MGPSHIFSVRVAGVNGTAEDIRLEDDLEREAVLTAFSACTPFGHSLWQGGRFVGWFEGGDKRLPETWILEAAAELGSGTRQ